MNVLAIVTLVCAALAALAGLVAVFLAVRGGTARNALAVLSAQLREQAQDTRREVAEQARGQRAELGEQLQQFGRLHVSQQGELRAGLEQRLQAFATELRTQGARQGDNQQRWLEDARKARGEQGEALQRFSETQQQALEKLAERHQQQAEFLRAKLEEALKTLRAENTEKLEQMRRTVDEKLNETLERRLGESFERVGKQLIHVQQGLGEMQSLAKGVGDLKRVLTNVKTRGTWAELELGSLLADLLTVEQYAAQVTVRQGTSEKVDFAVRLPGRHDGVPVWLPIDAKFPREDYEHLQNAQEAGDVDAIKRCGDDLERAVRIQAKSISDKYIVPPTTTDFAILFLPTEGLFAEVVRRPGLVDGLQREFRVVVAGPTTLSALLNSLQMGFRTLAIEKRSSEVWQVLGAVKTEFDKFGGVLEKVKKKLQEASNTLEQSEVRKRAVDRKLREVQALPDTESADLLELEKDPPGQEEIS
ncbi:MAG: DNA recombination protein RmuC [Nevskiaceae bacterium]|nr:MAG: DNA recombination protein RmuC [Nevskiaceae bacterium]TBR75292.1 MAG: DNA recombination protein RmuC [Nevskiaceae bacterium]